MDLTKDLHQLIDDAPPPKEPRCLRLNNEHSLFFGTLIDLTKLPKDLESSILVQLNKSRISPRSESTDFDPQDTSQGEKPGFDIHKICVTSQASESTQKQANPSHIAGTTPQVKPVSSLSAYNLTPD